MNCVTNFDLVFCSNTWQTKPDEFQLDGYKSVCVPRFESVSVNRKSHRGHGGVCLFIKETIIDGIHILEKDQNGFIWIKLYKDYFSMEFDICFCFAYIPPSESVYFKSHEIRFYEQLEISIRKYSQFGKICLMGDLNARTGKRDDFIESVDLYDKYIHTIDSETNECLFKLDSRESEDNICNSLGLKLLDVCKSTDLKILNGRVGDDKNIGRFTFVSSIGKSVIDYGLASYDLFPMISDFIVHDLFLFSTHVPIQANIAVQYNKHINVNNINSTRKLVWDVNNINQYNSLLLHESDNLNDIVSNIISSNVTVDDGIDTFGNILYDNAFKVFGVNKRANIHNKRQTNPWFTADCRTARSDVSKAKNT